MNITTGIFICTAITFIVLYRYLFGQKFLSSPSLKGEFLKKTIRTEKIIRSYAYYLPSNLQVEGSLLFVLHGAQDDGLIFRKRLGYEFDKIAEREGFIAVYPDGYKKSWNDCRAKANYPAKRENIDDLGFLKEIKKKISSDHQVQIKSVYIFGYSNGGQLAQRICMENPEFVKGAAIVAANLPTPENLACGKKDKALPLIFLHGTNDNTNPFGGGLVNVLGIKKMGHVKSAHETIEYWRKLADCTDFYQEEIKSKGDNKTHIEKRVWKKESTDFIVQYIVHGGGHTIPHPRINFPRILGPSNHDINFAQEVWGFFRQLAD